MKNHSPRKAANKTPTALGTGLLALDEVYGVDKSAPVRHWAGGTCGNVLIALRYLGWTTKPVARLEPGDATDLVLADLRRWGVSKEFIRVEPTGSTPIIVQRITRSASGALRHSFSWRCPDCGAPFSGYKPELVTVAETLAPKAKKAQLFFFDRVSAGAIHLAQSAAEGGALVVFEPCSIGNPILFRQAWELAHIVKYSHERLSDFPEMNVDSNPQLTIETLGDAGLRYRRWRPGQKPGAWIESQAIAVDGVKDTAGAGDWCTAGILSKVARTGFSGFSKLTDSQISSAIRNGQALASWCCRFEGARGGMYEVSKEQFAAQVKEILQGAPVQIPITRSKPSAASGSSGFCRQCDQAANVSATRKAKKAR
ncbi:MAG: carbohydrate kinase family protein [Planctomycetaceae bacterium]